ncbi:MAG: FkbH like protein, partial [Armatimonadetes bacterium]|nr:FkbH like protein [Armatimonadota bacterium]
MERGCPEALVLQLPARAEEIPGFLDHVWALDRAGTTREDRLRATHYQQNSAREVALQSAGSLAEFIERLELRVRIAPPSPEELERVAQLSQRVTQFNTQPATRTAGEIEGWIRGAGQGCRVVHVADRFGDYGLVGAVLFREEPAALVVESLLLSCRALGRGVEHRVLAHLGAQAAASGKAEVRFPTTVTARNRPALDFLHSVSQPDAAGTFVVSTVDAAEVEYRPGTEPAQPAVPASAPAPVEPRSNRAAALARLARLGGDVAALHAEVERSRLRSRVQLPGDPVPARSPLEVSLAEIAAAVLGFDHVGVRDNLFELGAHSLLLVQISSRIRDALGVTVPFTHWFQDPTVAGIAARLEAEAPAVDTAADRQAALLAQLEEMSDEEAERLLLELEGDTLPASPAPAWTLSPAPSAMPRSQAREAGAEPGIEIVAVLTRGRPDLVGRCLESVIENTSRHGRQPRLMVFDDTPAGAGSDLRACAGALASRHANSIGVFGTREARQLGEELVRTSGVSEDVVQFALHGDPVSDYSLGGNRNHMLLRTAGHAVYCTDNDVIVQPTPHPERRAGCGFSFGEDPGDYWFFPDADTEEQATPPSPDDFLAAHERLLGRRAADVLTSLAGYPGDPQSHRIALTSNGFVGDCGWGSPFGFWHAPMGYLLLEGASHARLVNSEADYRTACTSRRLLRVVPQDLVTDATFSMGGLMAFDNRHLLAPVFPSARGQDVVFGTVMWECFPDAVLGQVAQALRHTPIQPRRFWPGEMTRSASGMDLARFVIECIRVTGFSRAEAQPGRGLGQLGERLRDLAALPAVEFQHTVLRQARRSNEGWIALM